MNNELAKKAIESIKLANNGYADIGTNESVAREVRQAGFIVIKTRNLHGSTVFRGFTPKAQAALVSSPFGVSTYKSKSTFSVDADFEGAILARQETRQALYA